MPSRGGRHRGDRRRPRQRPDPARAQIAVRTVREEADQEGRRIPERAQLDARVVQDPARLLPHEPHRPVQLAPVAVHRILLAAAASRLPVDEPVGQALRPVVVVLGGRVVQIPVDDVPRIRGEEQQPVEAMLVVRGPGGDDEELGRDHRGGQGRAAPPVRREQQPEGRRGGEEEHDGSGEGREGPGRAPRSSASGQRRVRCRRIAASVRPASSSVNSVSAKAHWK